MTTVVFACKSNSCRSQMAEGWAKKWIEDERRKMVRDQLESDSIDRLKGFLDNLAVFSVALDETSVIATAGEGVSTMVLKRDEKVDSESMKNHGSSPCDDHMCSPPPQLRKSVKAKAIWAMAEDGVDISKSVPKTIHDVLPEILGKVNRSWSDGGKCFDQYTSDNGPDGMQGRKWEKLLSFIGLLRDLLEQSSREMGMAYAGVEKNNNDISTSKEEVESTTDNLIVKNEIAMSSHHNKVVDSLIVLCSCPDSLKRVIGEMSKETLEWDISAPTSAAKSGEGDSAYLRVSHQIRNNVNEFMNGLKYNYLSETSMTCLAGKCSDSHGVHLPVKTLSLVEEVLAD